MLVHQIFIVNTYFLRTIFIGVYLLITSMNIKRGKEMTEQERIRKERAMEKPGKGELMGHRFRMIHNAIDKFFAKTWEGDERELTRAQCATLHYLYDHRDIDIFQKDIEAVFSITGATATNMLKGLERQGIIERTPMEKDARLKRILLTKEGTRFHERALDNMDRLESALIAGMTGEEVRVYKKLLEQTIRNLDSLVSENNFHEGEK